MRSDRGVANNVVVHEGVVDRDPLAKFRRADDVIIFELMTFGSGAIASPPIYVTGSLPAVGCVPSSNTRSTCRRSSLQSK